MLLCGPSCSRFRYGCWSSRPIVMHGFLFFSVLLLGLVGTGCSPRLVPLYYDYRLSDTTASSLQPVAQALNAEGWRVSQLDFLHLETAPRTLQHWGLYRVVVRLKAVRVDGASCACLSTPTGNTSRAAAARSLTCRPSCAPRSCPNCCSAGGRRTGAGRHGFSAGPRAAELVGNFLQFDRIKVCVL